MQGRILSIQSHVSFGYVGGKAAVFPLQCLGFDVDVVNTVNFSNHSGYGRAGGSKVAAAELKAVFDGMHENELINPARILTGYIPGAEALSTIADIVQKLIDEDPSRIYLLDPVMGDAGRLYVAEDVIPVYQRMLHMATIITPNWFEVETLTETPLHDMGSLRCALRTLHTKYGVPHVVISSIPLSGWLATALPESVRPAAGSTEEHLLCITSSRCVDREDSERVASVVHARAVPLIPGYFSGVGDMFSALVLGHYDRMSASAATSHTPVSTATSWALARTHVVLQRTHEYSMSLPEDERQPSDDEKDRANPHPKTRRMRGRELRLVQSQDILRDETQPPELMPWTDFWMAIATTVVACIRAREWKTSNCKLMGQA
ncbi:Ribokinase-like protein [Fistulina hepatica ATCC 64428]|uniref:pyridoxal kinase n=1 Tax=Fistulina hepatica ATCC 64428 TaxID=1128425 RepID=A0A0D7AF14_9AGAR|nr:Ribokinase-like protein [Fistulina hepatica ATCC 64428]